MLLCSKAKASTSLNLERPRAPTYLTTGPLVSLGHCFLRAFVSNQVAGALAFFRVPTVSNPVPTLGRLAATRAHCVCLTGCAHFPPWRRGL